MNKKPCCKNCIYLKNCLISRNIDIYNFVCEGFKENKTEEK